MLTAKVYLISALILLFTVVTAHGQISNLNFNEMWALAIDNNLDIQNARLQIDRTRNMKKSSWDPGTTRFDWQRGQINSDLIDNLYIIHQNFGSPFEMSATKKYYQSEMNLNKYDQSRAIREVKKSLRTNYYAWIYENQRLIIVEKGIELFRRASEYTSLQYETGESNLLSKALMDSKWQELNITRDRVIVNKKSLVNRINVIVNANQHISPVEEPLKKLVVILPESNHDVNIDSVPEVAMERQRFQVARSLYGLTKSKISPYLSAGYFNQQLLQESGFQGFLVGIEFPLWFFPQKARIQAATVNMSIAENRYMYEKYRQENEFENLLMRYHQLIQNLQFYEEQRLDNARLIEANANLLYETGDIGYLEFVQNITTALQIQEDYWTLVNEYNQLVIEMYYFLDI